MKASELRDQLDALIAEHGDCEVMVSDEWEGADDPIGIREVGYWPASEHRNYHHVTNHPERFVIE